MMAGIVSNAVIQLAVAEVIAEIAADRRFDKNSHIAGNSSSNTNSIRSSNITITSGFKTHFVICGP